MNPSAELMIIKQMCSFKGFRKVLLDPIKTDFLSGRMNLELNRN